MTARPPWKGPWRFVLILGATLSSVTPLEAVAAQAAGQAGASRRLDRASIDVLIAEASQRFGVPIRWIRAVMRQESGFDPEATSSAGAMGLMQVMPGTYAELRRRHGFGPDPYHPRDNVMAGTAYLRELYDRFGPDGVLAAYNAGPGRYLEHRNQGRPLPAETRQYIARIGDLTGTPSIPNRSHIRSVDSDDPYRASLFPARSQGDLSLIGGLFVVLSSVVPPEGNAPE